LIDDLTFYLLHTKRQTYLHAYQRHLAPEEQEDLLGLLEKFEELFGGCQCLMPGEPYSLKLKPNTELVHAGPFPVPQKHLKLMKDEVNCLIELGVL